MRRTKVEYEPRFGACTPALAFALATTVTMIACICFFHICGSAFYYTILSPFCTYYFVFVTGLGLNCMGKIRDPTMDKYHLAVDAFGLTCFFFFPFYFVLSGLTLHPHLYYRLTAALIFFMMNFDTLLFQGKIFACFKSASVRMFVMIIIGFVLGTVIYLLASLEIFHTTMTPLPIVSSALAAFFFWVDLCMIFVHFPMGDVFGETKAIMKMGPAARGFVYLLLCMGMAILFAGIVVGITFIFNQTIVGVGALTLEDRFLHAFTVASYGFTPVILIAKYTDNYIPEFPLVPVDFNDKRGSRKALKNQKVSQKGKRMRRRFRDIFSFMIVGYLSYHFICVAAGFCGGKYPTTDFNVIYNGDESVVMLVAGLLSAHALCTLCCFLVKPVDPNADPKKGRQLQQQVEEDEQQGQSTPTPMRGGSAQQLSLPPDQQFMNPQFYSQAQLQMLMQQPGMTQAAPQYGQA
ncbi:hypothetical protein BLNAU_16807 [Blattamonas nauphoetae]|uniref:Uncharacterized protein n=1 Tax=Blattamonas nauphoetae TaxID=2049346 RepID=A0ABQ9X8N2_9EUKA|nr:hypothetical protein BLNAU_16807 [Blattamonas nauphoetae]